MSETSGDIIDEIGAILTVSERPTARLRFNMGRLEQTFEITRHEGGKPSSIEFEWRPVPQVPHEGQ